MKYLGQLRWDIPVLLVGAALWQALFSTALITASTDFVNRTPLLDVLLPAGRVERTAQGMSATAEPVYLDVRLPLRASSVSLELSVTAASAPLRLAVQQTSDFSLAFSKAPVQPTPTGQLYRITVTDFPYLLPDHTLRFVVSVPGLKPGGVVITGAKITIQRAPFSLSTL